MEHAEQGFCAVCGVTTTHRCSPCAENGFDLFLCGREHQKLIWFAHKRVCGVNSKPFRFPLLSPWEVEQTEEFLYTEIEDDHGHTLNLARDLAHVIGCAQSEVPTIIKILIEGCKSGFGTPNIIAQVVARVRYSLHILLCRLAVSLSPADRSVPLTPASHPLKSRDPHLSLGHSACELMSKMSPTTAELPSLPFPIDATWFPQAMQHLLVFAVLRRCKLKCLYERPVNGSRMNEIDSFMRASAKRMDEVVELVKKADPLWAKPLLEVMQFAVFASGAALLVKLE